MEVGGSAHVMLSFAVFLSWCFLGFSSRKASFPAVGSTYTTGVRGRSVLQVEKAVDDDGVFSITN